MSGYTTTAKIPAVGGVTVNVSRADLETDSRAVVRVTVLDDVRQMPAHLAREEAEALAVAILRAADLDPDHPQPEPRLAGDHGDPGVTTYRSRDRSLRVLERAVSEAVAHGVPVRELLGRVANGLTGSTNGPRERLAADAMAAAVGAFLGLTQTEARGIAATPYEGGYCLNCASYQCRHAHAAHGTPMSEDTRQSAEKDRPEEHGYGDESDCVCGRNFRTVRGLREHLTKSRDRVLPPDSPHADGADQ